MGEFRFRLPDDWRLTSRQATTIHIVGIDGIPWPVRVSTENNDTVVVIRRNRNESGKFFVAYPFPDFGELTVCTGSLPEREELYDLVTELARGNLNRLRTQISVWIEGGLQIGEAIMQATLESSDLLGSAILATESKTRDTFARDSLIKSMHVLFQLSRVFGDQVSNFRVSHPDFSKFWIAFNAGTPDANCPPAVQTLLGMPCFDFVELDPRWTRMPSGAGGEAILDTILNSKRGIIVGPLFDAGPGGMQTDLVDLDDFEARRAKILHTCRNVLHALPEQTAFLHVACGLNGMGHRQLSYPHQLQLTADILQLVEESSLEIPNILSFDFPWAERMASSVGGIHPLQIADTLLRQGLRISSLGMDINLDYWPGGSVLRDPLQWIDMIDVWSQLGLPLVICLRMPLDRSDVEQDTDHGQNGSSALVFKQRSNLTDQMRLDFFRDVLPVIFARPTVHGLILRQLTDIQDTRFPGGGIAHLDGDLKSIVEIVESSSAKFLTQRF